MRHALYLIAAPPRVVPSRCSLTCEYGRRFGFSSHATTRYTDVAFQDDDVLVFGSERAGLTEAATHWITDENMLSIPMREGRSLNVANAAAVVVYEAWRQQGFRGAGETGGSSTAERLHLKPFDR